MKMAIQYWYNQDQPEKHRFLTVRGGYHGDTFDAMSVCDPVNGMHHLFNKVLRQQYFADIPQTPVWGVWDDADIASFERLLAENHDQIAAAIFEPVVQGAGVCDSTAPTMCVEHGTYATSTTCY